MMRQVLAAVIFYGVLILSLAVSAFLAVYAYSLWWSAASPGFSSQSRRVFLGRLGDGSMFLSLTVFCYTAVAAIRSICVGRFRCRIIDLIVIPVVAMLLVALLKLL